MSFCGLCLLLLLGKVVRTAVPLLQRLFLPTSVIGGLLGLVAIQVCRRWFPQVELSGWTAGWSAMPGFLINIVFASLFIGASIPPLKTVWEQGAAQLCYGQICAWGQYVVGLALAGLVLVPLFHVNSAFGTLLEIGFEGGHGTVGGLSQTFEDLGWKEGGALGFTVATCGMVLGVSLGMTLINLAAKRGWIQGLKVDAHRDPLEMRGIYPPEEQPSAGSQTVRSDSVDSLAFHLAILGLAVFLGYLLKQALLELNGVLPQGIRELKVLESFPLFPLCMLGGLALQLFLRRTRLSHLVSGGQIQRLAGASLDFLVISAVASIRVEFILAQWMPLLLLILAGTAWNLFCVLYLAPRIFRGAWFERAIAEFGQSMGVTATGLLLLRTVDPESRTEAAKAFGYKQLLHEPIMGGGIWTSIALPLVVSRGNLTTWMICAIAVLFWLCFWKIFLGRAKREAQWKAPRLPGRGGANAPSP